MKQAVMVEPGVIRMENVEPPVPGPDDVLIRIARIGICGSDMHVYHGKHPYTSYPVIQGHEYSGRIAAVGSGVDGLTAGQLVTSLPQITCGVCAPCRRGDYHICDQLKVEGFQAPGVAREFFVTPASRVIALPEGFTPEQGAMVEPVAVAVHAVSQARTSMEHVVVMGGGTIGNLVAQVAAAAGARVLLGEPSAYRRKIAEACGISATFDPGNESVQDACRRVFGETGFSVGLECVGVESAIDGLIEGIAKGGTLVVVGVFGEIPRVNLGLVQDRELTLRGTLMYRRPDYEQAVNLMQSGAVRTQPLESHHVAFDEYLEAYKYLIAMGDRAMKVFVDVDR